MKKILSILLITLLIFSLSSCSALEDILNNLGSMNENSSKTDTIYSIITEEKTDVTVVGFIRYYDSDSFILSDTTGSIYGEYHNNTIPLQVGQKVEIKGKHFSSSNGHMIELNSLKTLEGMASEQSAAIINSHNINEYKNNSYGALYVDFTADLMNYGSAKLKIDNTMFFVKNSNAFNGYNDIKVSVRGWMYNFNGTYFSFILDEVYDIYNENIVGTKPRIITESDYYRYTNINNVMDLTNYFKIEDDEDGKVKVTNDMIDGVVIENKESLITLTYTDTDGNTVSRSITIYVGDYKGYHEEDNINVKMPLGLPTTGDVKVLVIPISFSGYPATNEMRNTIKKAFFGSEADTGWESLKTYYQKSSYGKLNITGDVTDWYSVKKTQDYYAKYEDSNNYYYGSTMILEEALKHFSNQYDYSDYDSNKDGIIDSVYLIYNTPLGGNSLLTFDDEFFWAYTSWDDNYQKRTYQSTKAFSYVFMGFDFFNDDLMFSSEKININTECLIHETGHLFGLDDYYDYNTIDFTNVGGYSVIDMMEYNIGDHGAFSKILLGWSNPVIISESGIYELPVFNDTGDCFVIGANNKYSTMYSEYYLIDYFTLDGLNSLELPAYFNTNKTNIGVRVSLVNAELTNDEGYYPYFTYDNSSTKHKLIKLLEADYDSSFDISSSDDPECELSDFYKVGDRFGDKYYNNFVSAEGNPVPFTMEVLEMTDESVIVHIKFK